MKVKVKQLHKKARLPEYATDGAACFDLHAATVDGVAGYYSIGEYVTNSRSIVCGTGLAFEIPEGYAMMVYSRSGHGFKHGVQLSNCVGVIDSDYRGELKVSLTQNTQDGRRENLLVKSGDRIAQAMIIPVQQVQFEEVDELSETERGAGGFGSTGQ